MILDKSKENIAKMFNSIAHAYDRFGHLLSLNFDQRWRKRLVKKLKIDENSQILDVATGTGCLVSMMAKKNPQKIVGVDIAEKMLEVAKKKTKNQYENIVNFMHADAENLPFPDESFDILTIAFGIRNISNPNIALDEFYRVLKPNGKLVMLELTMPQRWFMGLYRIYIFKVFPLMGKLISGNKKPYVYLPHSIKQFKQGEELLSSTSKHGFEKNSIESLMFGIANIYCVNKIPLHQRVKNSELNEGVIFQKQNKICKKAFID
ncbi:MAG: bifunctional demethylmenaquinone methyltransferase/2-methoxy-6-polyprenyl-1,4-benzoquinol methylase UbiE [Bacteroidales bacterium]|jgi:demethylmenaquinone methyltransferase/2-methoxy-6-polyprenyl-1,4-benzoquinol methylase|nr:bifunctional demethylmenaquinone methyltransferase/2-methoxy-6-polyprenyl-1,4-benzoquinol methylase UbiE [Bacteroidales bacterium]